MSVMHNDHLGYITSDPKNLGTALKLSARIKLPRLSRDGRLSTLLKMNGLSMSTRMVAEVQQVSEVDEVVDAENSIVEVTSVTSLGKSEVQVAAEFVDAVNKIIEAECMLQDGRDFNELIKKK
jgi:protein-arginine kinase